MITEKNLQEAIAYYNGKLDPSPQDAIMLAACYMLQDRMFPQEQTRSYSLPIAPPETQYGYSGAARDTVGEYGDSDFLLAVSEKNPAAAWEIIDGHMENLRAVNPRAYEGVMERLRRI